MQVAWTGVPTGPDHCVGRIIYRTKDLVNSGDIKFYELPLNAASVATGFATLPDNVTTVYPDNIPDSFLALPIQEFVPVPKFKLCQIAFGRLWIGNIEGSEGMIRPSMPGQWGTFKKNEELYPDPAGGEITGMRRCDRYRKRWGAWPRTQYGPYQTGSQYGSLRTDSILSTVQRFRSYRHNSRSSFVASPRVATRRRAPPTTRRRRSTAAGYLRTDLSRTTLVLFLMVADGELGQT